MSNIEVAKIEKKTQCIFAISTLLAQHFLPFRKEKITLTKYFKKKLINYLEIQNNFPNLCDIILISF